MIFLDGRSLESDPERTWMGYSVGRWEGDRLVVESFGFNDRTWLNPVGLPHTAALRITERYTRRSYGQMDVDLTIVDPEAFKTPWTASVRLDLRVDTRKWKLRPSTRGRNGAFCHAGKLPRERRQRRCAPQH